MDGAADDRFILCERAGTSTCGHREKPSRRFTHSDAVAGRDAWIIVR